MRLSPAAREWYVHGKRARDKRRAAIEFCNFFRVGKVGGGGSRRNGMGGLRFSVAEWR